MDTGIPASPEWMPAALGVTLGTLFTALNRFAMKRFWRAPRAPLNIVITGSTRGIGKAMARDFLKYDCSGF